MEYNIYAYANSSYASPEQAIVEGGGIISTVELPEVITEKYLTRAPIADVLETAVNALEIFGNTSDVRFFITERNTDKIVFVLTQSAWVAR